MAAEAAQLQELARTHRVLLAGPEPVAEIAATIEAESLSEGPIEGARELCGL